MESTAQVKKQGRITIPYTVRQMLAIEEGDFVTFEIKNVLKQADVKL